MTVIIDINVEVLGIDAVGIAHKIRVPGKLTPVKGLALTPVIGLVHGLPFPLTDDFLHSTRCVITHLPTGKQVCGPFNGFRYAMKYVNLLEEWDWSGERGLPSAEDILPMIEGNNRGFKGRYTA